MFDTKTISFRIHVRKERVAMYCVRLRLVYFQAWIKVVCPVCTVFVFQCYSFE